VRRAPLLVAAGIGPGGTGRAGRWIAPGIWPGNGGDRMRFRMASVMVGAALALLPAAEASAKEGKFFAAQINYMVGSLSGTGQTQSETVGPGTAFDFEDTLGVTQEDKLPTADLWFSFGRNSFLLSYFGASYEGQADLPSDLVFEDTTFPAGTASASVLDLKLAKLQYNFRFIDADAVDFGLLAGADLLSGKGEVASVPPGIEGSTDFSTPLPVLGLNVTVKVPATGLVFYFESSGMKLNTSDFDGTLLDAQARLTWYILSGPFGLSAGYRLFDLDVDVVDEGNVDLRQTAYFGGVSVRF
jgi:hypothetical protein